MTKNLGKIINRAWSMKDVVQLYQNSKRG